MLEVPPWKIFEDDLKSFWMMIFRQQKYMKLLIDDTELCISNYILICVCWRLRYLDFCRHSGDKIKISYLQRIPAHEALKAR